MENIDDGGLACLGIDVVAETRQFNCAIVAQQKIVNTTFYVMDIIDKVKTKHGDDRMLVKIKTKLCKANKTTRPTKRNNRCTVQTQPLRVAWLGKIQ